MKAIRPNILLLGLGVLCLAAYAIHQDMKDAVLVLAGGVVGVVSTLVDKE